MEIAELWEHRQSDDSADATAEWHRRFILPSTILVLMLFALPLSIEPKRSGKAGAYLLGVATILVVYNVQIALHRQVANGNLVWWSMWLGQALMAGVGLHLSRRTIRDDLPAWLNQGGEYIYLIHHRLQHWLADRRR
ncbi:MAG: LptF/LptG family permease [Mariprofundaceae bacterium]